MQFAVGESTVTYNADDGNGNNAVPCSFTVTVTDVEAPTITCPADITVEVDGTTDPYITGMPTSGDNCASEITFSDDRTALD